MPAQWTAGDALDAGGVEIARLGLLLPALLAVELRDVHDHAAFAGCQSLALDDLSRGCATSSAAGYELVTRTPVPLRAWA